MIGSYKLGFEHSTVSLNGSPYLERWFIAIAGWTFRLHRFHRGDDDRAPHSHPWPFWTFPLKGYWEEVYSPAGGYTTRYVDPWRAHYRPAAYRHIVLGAACKAPWWTIVVTAPKQQSWGFYPRPDQFIPWREWR